MLLFFGLILKLARKLGWAHAQILFFIVSFHFTSKTTVVAGLIIWLTIVSMSLGLFDTQKVIKAVNNV